MSDRKWEDPPKLSAEEEFLAAMDKMPPRDGIIFGAVATLARLQYRKDHPPMDQEHYIELARNLLNAVKHTAEMELLGFLCEAIRDGEGLSSRQEIVLLLAQGAQVAKEATLRALTLTENLARAGGLK